MSNSSTVPPDQQSDEAWKSRLLMFSGNVCLASFVELILGCTGAIGFLMRFIGPITISVSVSLIGLSLFPSVASSAKHQWGIAMMVVGLIILFGFILDKIQLPFPSYRKTKGCHVVNYPVFKLFPHLLAIALTWLLSHVLTITDVFPSNPETLQYRARTDVKIDVIKKAKWLFLPYPGRWGWPTMELGTFVGMLAATISSIVESIGDYYATASVCNVPPPPKHAVNRGIAMEGLSGILAGLLSAGHSTTSYSTTVGFIGITGIKARVVWQVYGVIMLLCGCFGKIGAALSIIPDPILGGLSIVGFGMLIAVGLANIAYVDAKSPRNMMIMGVSILLGMAVPNWINANPGIINTGYFEVDQLLTVVMGTAMFVGGISACLMDNIIPGTRAERGLDALNVTASSDSEADEGLRLRLKNTYGLPYFCDLLDGKKYSSYIPFLPAYTEKIPKCRYNMLNAEEQNNLDFMTRL